MSRVETRRVTCALIMTGLLATVATGQTPDVRWTFGNVGSSSYRLDAFSPGSANFGPLGVQDPTLPLDEGKRYEVTVINEQAHPLEILAKGDSADQDVVLLSMAPGIGGHYEAGLFEADPNVAWIEHGQGRVSFTLTPQLHSAMQLGGRTPGYRCRSHATRMRGDFTVAVALAKIIWVTEAKDQNADDVQDDHGFIDLLTDAGYAVDVQLDRWKQLEGQDANDANDYVAELNAADLVIISHTSNSGNYDDGNEPTLWNGVTSPLLQMSAYLPRSSRWRWINSTSVSDQEAPLMVVIDANHPVLAGVEVDPNGLVIPLDGAVGAGTTSFLATADAGNGTVIATTLAGDVWVAEWAAGAEFYEGSGQVAGGPRMVFFAGTQEVGATPQGGMNLTDAGIQLYLNAVDYMIPDLPAALTAALTGTSSATGSALLQPNAEGTAISYVLSVADLVNTTRAHIHVSDAPGGNGEPVVWLMDTDFSLPGSFTGVLSKGEITAANFVGSLAGQSLDALIQAIQENRAYVLVHTFQPGGEIRGQLE